MLLTFQRYLSTCSILCGKVRERFKLFSDVHYCIVYQDEHTDYVVIRNITMDHGTTHSIKARAITRLCKIIMFQYHFSLSISCSEVYRLSFIVEHGGSTPLFSVTTWVLLQTFTPLVCLPLSYTSACTTVVSFVTTLGDNLVEKLPRACPTAQKHPPVRKMYNSSKY